MFSVPSQFLTTRKQNHEASNHWVHLVLLHLQCYVPFSLANLTLVAAFVMLSCCSELCEAVQVLAVLQHWQAVVECYD